MGYDGHRARGAAEGWVNCFRQRGTAPCCLTPRARMDHHAIEMGKLWCKYYASYEMRRRVGTPGMHTRHVTDWEPTPTLVSRTWEQHIGSGHTAPPF